MLAISSNIAIIIEESFYMEVFNFLKNIYKGENALANHITLFSLAGIMVILLSCYSASWGNLILPNVFIAPPESRLELTIELFFGFLIAIYLTGYSFSFVNLRFNNEFVGIPEFNSRPFSLFLKFLPVFIIWLLYYTLFLVGGVLVFLNANQIVLLYIFVSIMICLIPFIMLLFINFSKNFKYERKLFNPLYILRYVDKALGDIIYLSVEVFIMFAIVSSAIFYITTIHLKSDSLRLAIWLMSSCVWIYSVFIFKYVYYTGLVKIINKHPEFNN